MRDHLGSVTPRRVLDAGEPRLRHLGVARQKAAYLVALAADLADRRLSLVAVARASNDEARRALLQVKGIGPWTADVYLLMALRRPDVWPAGDLALITALTRLRGLRRRSSDAAARRNAERWAPWRAARVLWHGYLRGTLQ